MNMLEDADGETFDAKYVSPFEIITVGIPLKQEEIKA